MQPLPAIAQSVLDYWFADGLQRGWPSTGMKDVWFGGGAEQDAEIQERFGDAVETALGGGWTEWEADPLSRLALVVLLDQFSRNIHRGSPRAFAGDGRAQKLVLQSLALGGDEELPWVGKLFFYMPLMHAESHALQDECVMRFEALVRQAPAELKDTLEGNLRFAQQHLDIIESFGRFPHRNESLGRTSTPEETEFLVNGPRFGQ